MGMAWVFDSIDKDPSTYKDFIAILKTAYRFYVKTHKGRHDPKRKENMCVKIKCACPKQKPESVHCRYYVCSIISNITTYRRHPCRWQDEKGVRNDPHKDDNLLDLVNDLCNFIMDQIVHVRDTYHGPLSDLGRNPQYQHLRE
ncbi:uncharacterized protein [Miscanthus floridulus]|uniref:uncharacterized protein n=1 Tax=Miscanthus floridulus TaxID=154761 RepID=UPI00345B3315